MKIIDSHIHLDTYCAEEQKQILANEDFSYLITVSMHLQSAITNLQLAKKDQRVQAAFGFHPEQPLPSEKEIQQLLTWMDEHQDEMVAVGEVGLPYYLRQEQAAVDLEAYIALLERFILFAKETNKPIILHAVYEDAPIVCDLLENHNVTKAHFHWFKGSKETVKRMISNGYYISITPDICYEEEIQQLVQSYPLELMMVETDGPWPFEERFEGQMTSPSMIHESIKKIAHIKQVEIENVYEILYQNTIKFYELV
ncbi:TatD family hydrolase [Bacillus massiliigorillae]|uniref:TatD family hydrolase n=1 Tax=Bacillus massiliigorillae TaxID=1243664 RepID=UPI0003A79EC7|nr:TatD family hydrolase [Bacillus massiliigorillae]